MRYPDNPQLIDTDFLERLDKDFAGTWFAQPKYNGFRRVAWLAGDVWTWQAKHTAGPAAKELPDDLLADWTEFTKPLCGYGPVGIDMEFMGPRGQHPPGLCIFDLLMWGGKWLGGTKFVDRYAALSRVYVDLLQTAKNGRRDELFSRIELLPCWSNPGLPVRFVEQLTDPRSEGLVIRRHDSGLIGSSSRPTNNPLWFKLKHQPALNRVLKHMVE
jgi:hypothetical protein